MFFVENNLRHPSLSSYQVPEAEVGASQVSYKLNLPAATATTLFQVTVTLGPLNNSPNRPPFSCPCPLEPTPNRAAGKMLHNMSEMTLFLIGLFRFRDKVKVSTISYNTLSQWSPIFSATGSDFMKDNFFTAGVEGWRGGDGFRVIQAHFLCTVFPLLLYQLHRRSSGTRSQRLGTPDLNDLPPRPGSLLKHSSFHPALLTLIQLCWPQGLCTGFSLPGIHMASSPPLSLSFFKYHFPCEGCPSALFKSIVHTHTYTYTYTIYFLYTCHH